MFERYLLPAVFFFVGLFTWQLVIGILFGFILPKDVFFSMLEQPFWIILALLTSLFFGVFFVWLYVAKRARYRFMFHSVAIIEFSFLGGVMFAQLTIGHQSSFLIVSSGIVAVLLSWGLYIRQYMLNKNTNSNFQS